MAQRVGFRTDKITRRPGTNVVCARCCPTCCAAPQVRCHQRGRGRQRAPAVRPATAAPRAVPVAGARSRAGRGSVRVRRVLSAAQSIMMRGLSARADGVRVYTDCARPALLLCAASSTAACRASHRVRPGRCPPPLRPSCCQPPSLPLYPTHLYFVFLRSPLLFRLRSPALPGHNLTHPASATLGPQGMSK